MSLFGSEDNSTLIGSSKSRNSIFYDEDSSVPGIRSNLFTDEFPPNSSSWASPAVNKSRRDYIKDLLPTSAVPENYKQIFRNRVEGRNRASEVILREEIIKVLSDSKLNCVFERLILQTIYQGSQAEDLTRNEFNVLLALIGLAQINEEISIERVEERKQNLPIPNLSGTSTSSSSSPPPRPRIQNLISKPLEQSNVSRETPKKKNLYEFADADPWANSDLHQNHLSINSEIDERDEEARNEDHKPTNSTGNDRIIYRDKSSRAISRPNESKSAPAGAYDSDNLGSLKRNSAVQTVEGSKCFRNGIGDQPVLNAAGQPYCDSQVRSTGAEETIVVTLLPEKEGIFMFQHHCYHVISVRRGTKVVRRFSDFVWLLDCLHKRFPFRQLPLLPPKRLGLNGNHLAADSTFIEKRRRGLTRFANALIEHPVLSHERLVISFLTLPTEFSTWRKQITSSIQEEFSGRLLPPGLEDSLSPTLDDLFQRTRAGIRRSADIYINLCILIDRIAKRNEGFAADQLRISHSLQSLSDVAGDTYSKDTCNVPRLNQSLLVSAKHLSNSQMLFTDEAKSWEQGILEDLKKQRDSLVSMRDLFDRRDLYDKDNIPYLERRIEKNEKKLEDIESKPVLVPGEKEKVADAIIKDKESIVSQHARGVFVKECIRDELVHFQQTQNHMISWNQNWAQERIKYSELQADNWKQLNEELENIPIS